MTTLEKLTDEEAHELIRQLHEELNKISGKDWSVICRGWEPENEDPYDTRN
jgi:hypothetical protein